MQNTTFSSAKIITALLLGYCCAAAWVIYADIVYHNQVPLEAFEFHGLYPIGLGLSATITALFFDRNIKSLGFARCNWKYIGIAIGLAALLLVVPFAINLLSGLVQLNPTPKFEKELVFVGIPVLIILAIGEEVMWRGLLFSEFSKRFSFISTALIIAVFWLLWHLPVIIHTKFIYADRPLWFTLVAFPINIVSLSFVYNYLRRQSNSLWPVVILHAFTNYFAFLGIVPLEQAVGNTYFINDIGVTYVLTNAVAGGWVVWKMRKTG